mmetsp:Transcript_39840/g.29393  ORF Transcript_39840/g.29393 Transcript_39840/m.29393 type:complete len:87 (-) Transcript_39840:1125-1385(-)
MVQQPSSPSKFSPQEYFVLKEVIDTLNTKIDSLHKFIDGLQETLSQKDAQVQKYKALVQKGQPLPEKVIYPSPDRKARKPRVNMLP